MLIHCTAHKCLAMSRHGDIDQRTGNDSIAINRVTNVELGDVNERIIVQRSVCVMSYKGHRDDMVESKRIQVQGRCICRARWMERYIDARGGENQATCTTL